MESATGPTRLSLVPASATEATLHEPAQRRPAHRCAQEAGQDGRGDPADGTCVSGPGRPAPGSARPGLLLVSAPEPDVVGSCFTIDASGVIIGRTGQNDIRVNDPGVSRSHVRIRRGPGGEFVAEDLGSTNGTWLNGVSIRSAVLSEGDRLEIGTSTAFLFGMRREAAQAEIRLRQAVSTTGAGTWEWLSQSGALQIHGGIARTIGHAADVTEPRALDSWPRVHPEDRDALRARLEAALQRGEAAELEARLVRPDGVVVWVAMTGEPFRDRDGRAVRLAGALVDITERRRAQAELQRQSLLFESLADAVVVVGRDGTILDWSASAERLLGWTKAEALGRRPGTLLLPGDAEWLDQALTQCSGGGERRSEELTLRTKSGAEVPAEMVAVPLVAREEDLSACVAIFRNLGERRQLQARLQVAERLASLGTLAAGVAHEINNPLAYVASNLAYVSRQLESAGDSLGPLHAEVAAALADSRKGAERIASIIRDLQAFGGRERPDAPSEVDPNAVLEFALRMAESKIRHRARLEKDLRNVPRVLGGEARLGQVFLNLLVNASQAIEPGHAAEGVIRVGSRFDPARRRVVIEVSDNGAGMAPDTVAHIFEPFFTTKPVGSGSGLGLFVCRGIVNDLGGEIAVESEVGKGTTVRVLLPAGSAVPGETTDRPRVLVVDDEPLLGVALKRFFADRYDVVGVADPQEALERIRAGERFMFAVVDVQMPGMLGHEFLARLRELAPGLARRCAVVTGGVLEELSGTFPEAEQPPLLAKPIDLARLAALIDAAAEGDGR